MKKNLFYTISVAFSILMFFQFVIHADASETSCMTRVYQTGEKFIIKLLDSEGNRHADCRFTDYTQEIISGEAKMTEMNEYSLTYDKTKRGKIKITTTAPTYYWAEFNIIPTENNESDIYFAITDRSPKSIIEGKNVKLVQFEITAYENKSDVLSSLHINLGGDFRRTQITNFGLQQVFPPDDSYNRFESYYKVNLPADSNRLSFDPMGHLLDSEKSVYAVFGDVKGSGSISFDFTSGIETSNNSKIDYLNNSTGLLYFGQSGSENTTETNTPKAGYEAEVFTVKYISKSPFTDTIVDSDEGQAAANLYNMGIIGGYVDGEFKGRNPVNRAEAAKFLLFAKGLEVSEKSNNGKFWDVKEGEWYVKFVMEAAELGIIKGYSDGSFRPADGVRRGEFLKMIAETFVLQKNLSHNYTDVAGSWVEEYAGIANKYKLFSTQDTELRFGDFMTRNEVAVAIYQYLKGRE